MALQFRKAVKSQAKARIGIIGPSGCGKTYTALLLAKELGNRIAVIDTEHGSASKYADEFDFDVLELTKFHPQLYIDGIKAAAQAGYDVLIIDSLSHAWAGTEGALELADKNAAKYGGNRFAAWRDVTPLHNKLIEAMLSYPGHLIATLRSKMEYIQTVDDKGKTVIKKVGMQPIQRDGMEYEFDIVADMDLDHNFVVTKTRCRALDGLIVQKPGKDVADMIKAWLSDGAPAATTVVDKGTSNTESTEKPNWNRFWGKMRKLGLDHAQVHSFAAELYKVEKVESLTNFVQTQHDLDKLAAYIERRVQLMPPKSAAAGVSS